MQSSSCPSRSKFSYPFRCVIGYHDSVTHSLFLSEMMMQNERCILNTQCHYDDCFELCVIFIIDFDTCFHNFLKSSVASAFQTPPSFQWNNGVAFARHQVLPQYVEPCLLQAGGAGWKVCHWQPGPHRGAALCNDTATQNPCQGAIKKQSSMVMEKVEAKTNMFDSDK